MQTNSSEKYPDTSDMEQLKRKDYEALRNQENKKRRTPLEVVVRKKRSLKHKPDPNQQNQRKLPIPVRVY